MRRPTLSETFAIVLLWALVLRKIFRSFESSSFDTGILVWGIVALMWTYRFCSAEAYTNHKKKSAAREEYMTQRFGRWRLLVEWSPILFLFAMLLLGMLFRKQGLTFVLIGAVGLLIGSLWVSCLGPDPDDP